MARANPYIAHLRSLGVTDYQRRKLRGLMKELEAEQAYSRIARLNSELLGFRTAPMELNYENLVGFMEYGNYEYEEVYGMYKEHLAHLRQDTTKDYEEWLRNFTNELQDIGATSATIDTVRNSNQKDLEYYYGRYQYYESVSDVRGMEWALSMIEKTIIAGM